MKLIHWLGGFTGEELALRVKEFLDANNRITENLVQVKDQLIALKTVEVQSLTQQLEDAKKDRDFYREKLFLEKGILYPEVETNPQQRTHLEPISTGRVPWSTRRRRLEREDANKAAEALQDAKAQVDATRDHWDKKNKEVEKKNNAVQ
jgi:ABC-type cobalamin/Fe3+-siderophores transport system ATPase subunit